MKNFDLLGVVSPAVDRQLRFGGSKVHVVAGTPTYRIAKRLLDIFSSLLILLAVAPLVIFLIIVIRLDGSPALYGQRRLGQHGRPFVLWKLRSMVPDADRRLAQHLEGNLAARAEWEANQKLQRDPRVTRFGKFLRKYSLDELPQLFNVLRGDMSMVGPRPMMVEQEQLYPGEAYAGLRPGLTGLWQISKRDDATFAVRAKFDALYAANLSFWGDLRIVLLTFGYLFGGRGC
jgi:exopolysaccharide production protein ExoY